jgi:chromosomal replication initiation ATPase DnaA
METVISRTDNVAINSGTDQYLATKKAEIEAYIGREVFLEVIGVAQIDRTELIQKIICGEFGVTWPDITGHRRWVNLVLARHFYCYYAKLFMGHGPRVLGNTINKDHSTTIHGVNKLNVLLSVKDPITQRHYESLTEKFSKIFLDLKSNPNV